MHVPSSAEVIMNTYSNIHIQGPKQAQILNAKEKHVCLDAKSFTMQWDWYLCEQKLKCTIYYRASGVL